jgi:peptidase M50-like protein
MRLLPPALERACASLQVVMGIAAIIALYVAAFSLGTAIHRRMSEWSFIYFVLLSGGAVATHEIGHLVAARLAGMTPFGLQVGPLCLSATRRGWRFRSRRIAQRVSGYAIAFPDPARPVRSQFTVMTWGGPIANLGIAALAAIALTFAHRAEIVSFLVAIGAGNALMGLANLLPSRRTFYSDGMALLNWHREASEHDAPAVYARLMGRSVRGTTADRLPEDEVAFIEAQPLPYSLVAFWLRLKAAQNQHDWQRVDELGTQLAKMTEAMTPEQFRTNPILIELARAEIAFSRALMHRDAHLLDVELTKSVKAWAPECVLRMAALRAALADDARTRDRKLADAARSAARSVDLALEKSEAMIAEAVLAVAVAPSMEFAATT